MSRIGFGLGLLAASGCSLDWSAPRSSSDAGPDGSVLDAGTNSDAASSPDANVADPAAEDGAPSPDPDGSDAAVDTPEGGAPERDSAAPEDTEIAREGLLLWLRADRGVAADATGVTLWADQSAMHADAAQLTVSARPALRVAPGNVNPAIHFDGVDDYLAVPPGFDDFTAGLSVFVVALNQPQSLQATFFEASNGREIDDLSIARSEAGTLLSEVFEEPLFGDALPVSVQQQFSVIIRPSGDLDMRLNGASLGTAHYMHPPSVVIRQEVFVGRSLYERTLPFAGDLYELLVYRRALSDAEVLRLEQALRTRWNCCTQ